MANILIKQGLEIAVPDFVITTDEARKVDLTSIIQTGTTSSQAISAGKYFYLNNVLVRAKADIANGATFTLNTNYEVVTAGALNELKDAISDITGIKKSRLTVNTTSLGQVRIDTLVAGRTIVALVPNIGTDFYRTFIGFVGTAQGEQLIAQFLGSNGSAIGATSVTFDLFYY